MEITDYGLVCGNKFFELTNHLGNVLETITDKKIPVIIGSSISYYTADVVSANDYYPFGMQMPGRSYSSGNDSFRYSFNSQEKTDEIAGAGNHTTALFWEYDTRLGRRWNLDPKPNTSKSGYAAFANNPIFFVDVNGDTLGIGGSQPNQDAFLAQINTGETKFKIDANGNLALDNPTAKVVGQFAT